MFRLTIKNLLANKVRFALTTFGVMLAVSFVVSAFVLGDGLRSSFTKVTEEATAGVDLEIRSVAEFGDPAPLPISIVDRVAGVDGVEDAVPIIEADDNAVRPLRADGEPLPLNGQPQMAFNWVANDELSSFSVVDGAAPGVGEFTMDVDAADTHGFEVGQTYEVIVPDGRVDLTLSGTTSFGADNTTLGAVLMHMNIADASELFGVDGVSQVVVELADGADLAATHAAVEAAIGSGYPDVDVADRATVLAESTEEFTREIDLFSNILLGFGLVSLFVSTFIIYNTFAIVLSQRTRELALLRTVGADPTQIKRSVLGEAVVVGALASVGGIGGGVLVAKGLEAMFGAMGAELPDYPLIFATRTLVVAVLIGMGVTMLAAIGPARRAATVPPITALTGGTEAGTPGSRTRKLSGFGLIAVGLVAGAIGLSGAGPTAATVAGLAGGAVAMFLGVTLLSPMVVGAVTSVLGWPMRRVAGVVGRLAQQNAARNPRRTATTAAALMIGLALVSAALVAGESVKATIGTTVERSAIADYVITDELLDADFPASLAGDIRAEELVAGAAGFTHLEAKVDGTVTDVVGFEFDQIDRLLDLSVQDGSFVTDVVHPVVVSTDEATELGLTPGDTVTTEFSNGSTVETTIVALFDDQAILAEHYLVDRSVLVDAGVTPSAEWLAVALIDDAPAAEVATLVAALGDEYPAAAVETADEFRKRIQGSIDESLATVNVMVALAVIIALIGIANTLALSVFERTRELGLVRAVGMTRRQLRRMVRFEAALVATFGAVLGVGLGIFFGWALTTALPSSFAASTAVPIGSIVTLMIVAGLAGVVAAWLPARRAGRLDVLDAISH